ncbi:hypothetical protein SCMU_05620 [Sinomonas cyclohexanicum]|uniref:M23ase beta-sheet core domain-containing protein n=1 Tax=Sinomonas cyclohexanicum TaxID=322009 RepID=A0ABM7PR98_SINCY|nr:M23 family metallopeptidase [Corynebacterium cyclohexanicum]BCT74720.1 hypothetical protein SCMU_05620 [Corynebacterium cyclohexanicum]
MARAVAATLSRLRARFSAGLAAVVAVVAFGAAPALAGDVYPGPVTADPHAVVSFYRTDVGSLAAGHVSPVYVAQADLGRPETGKLYAPLTTLVPTSGFGYRTSPLTGQVGEFHWGQDFAAACGTPVYAADSGVVRAAGWHPWGGGNRVEIDHGNGLVTTYNHMLGAAVKTGEPVEVGQVIGLVGSTGSSTGCHLHFETIRDGKYIDPMTFTFIPIAQKAALGTVQVTDYTPKDGNATNTRQPWAIPALAQEPTPGETITPAPSAPTPPPLVDPTPAGPPAAPPSTTQATPPAAASPSPSPSASSSTTASPSPSASPSPTATATPSATPTTSSPTATATPSPTADPAATTKAAAAPTTAAATTPTATSTCTPAPTASPTPTPTATTAPTAAGHC